MPVAFLYCYQYDEVVSAYQTAFDIKYKKMSPGSLVMNLAIEVAIDEGAREIDLLRGDHSYKSYIAKTLTLPAQNNSFSQSRHKSIHLPFAH